MAYPGVDNAWCLDQHHLLQELYAADAHAGCGSVHASQDGGFDGGHELPVVGIVGVRDTAAGSYMRESST